MKEISIDIETYSGADIAKCGVYKYAESPDFTVLLFGFSMDGGPVRVVDLAAGERIAKPVLDALSDPRVEKWAYNASFERVCLSRYLGLPTGHYLDPRGWRCSMVWGSALGLPMGLAKIGAVLGLERQKLAVGKRLIALFCAPHEGVRADPRNYPEEWAVFKEYNARDVEAEMGIHRRLAPYPLPDFVWAEYWDDQEINDRGVLVDQDLARAAVEMNGVISARLMARMQRLTGLRNPASPAQLKQWLAAQGCGMDTLGKKEVARALKQAPAAVREVLRLRQASAKSSIAKYTAMLNTACADGRCRGMFQFYGSRTGRFAGRLLQLQNLPQNHIGNIAAVREIARRGDLEALEALFDSVPDVLSQLIRTAFIAAPGKRFVVADYSSVEARVIAWYAHEEKLLETFRNSGDIYCATASAMFGVPVVKHGINGELRQKGKVAVLACIAQGQKVLTDHGPVPIEEVTRGMRVWDGVEWVEHEGVVFKGIREVMTYEGLTATPDHLVFIEGQSRPVQLADAAASGAHLQKAGNGGDGIWERGNHQPGEALERGVEPLLRACAVPQVSEGALDGSGRADIGALERVPGMQSEEADTPLAGSSSYGGEAKMHQPRGSQISGLRGAGDPVRISERDGSGALPDTDAGATEPLHGTGSDRQQRELRSGEPSVGDAQGELRQPPDHCAGHVGPRVLALCTGNGGPDALAGSNAGSDSGKRPKSRDGASQGLAANRRTARVYDIRNAGRRHRYAVSGVIVHNCGYGGAVGALTAMGALDMGLKEDELQGIVEKYRAANPGIVRFWWDVDRAVRDAIATGHGGETHGLAFWCEDGRLFIRLPSGRRLAYWHPEIEAGEVSYETDQAHQWRRVKSYGPKFVENIVQATARDLLCGAMRRLQRLGIVMHIHDEVVVECGPETTLDHVSAEMARAPAWAPDMLLRADGYETPFYMKD